MNLKWERVLPFRERQNGTRAISKIVPTGSSYCRFENSPIDRLASQKNGQENFSRKNKLLFSEFPYPNFRASFSNQPKDFFFFKPPIFSLIFSTLKPRNSYQKKEYPRNSEPKGLYIENQLGVIFEIRKIRYFGIFKFDPPPAPFLSSIRTNLGLVDQ